MNRQCSRTGCARGGVIDALVPVRSVARLARRSDGRARPARATTSASATPCACRCPTAGGWRTVGAADVLALLDRITTRRLIGPTTAGPPVVSPVVPRSPRSPRRRVARDRARIRVGQPRRAWLGWLAGRATWSARQSSPRPATTRRRRRPRCGSRAVGPVGCGCRCSSVCGCVERRFGPGRLRRRLRPAVRARRPRRACRSACSTQLVLLRLVYWPLEALWPADVQPRRRSNGTPATCTTGPTARGSSSCLLVVVVGAPSSRSSSTGACCRVRSPGASTTGSRWSRVAALVRGGPLPAGRDSRAVRRRPGPRLCARCVPVVSAWASWPTWRSTPPD